MKIAHFYAKTPNLGDVGSARGIQQLLLSLKGDLEFEEFNIQKKDLKRSEIKKINQECKALIIGGGGLLYNVKRTSSNFNFNIKLSHYKNILSIPKCFFSIGINAEYTQNEKWKLRKTTINNIKSYVENSDLISVRDMESNNFLTNLNLNSQLIPCPSMFLLNDIKTIKKEQSFAFNLTNRISDNKILYMIATNILEYAKKIKTKPILIVHHKNEDKECLEIAKSLNMEVYIPPSPESLMLFYKKQQFLVGMRGHSLIFATGAHIPMISLSYNKKCDAHMSLFDMTDYSITPPNFTDKKLLFSTADRMLAEKKNIVSILNEKTMYFYTSSLNFANRFLHLIS
jgi:polysaccharide pyruvyl transferase WcaK-like protein